MPDRLAIMLHHGLGDVICALPALWAADRLVGTSGVFDVAVKSPLEASVVGAIPWFGTVRTYCLPGGSTLRRTIRTLAVAKAFRDNRPQVFLAPHIVSPRLADVVARLVRAPVSILPALGSEDGAPHSIAAKSGEHKAQQYARYFVAAGLPIDLAALRFPPIHIKVAWMYATGTRVVIAPAVGAIAEQHKRWPEASFAELANLIAQKWPDVAIELFAAPTERPVLDRVYAGLDDDSRTRVTISTPPSPAVAAKALAGAACVITSCSGASHLAAWAGVPIVGIYGPTNPGYTGAFSGRLYVVRKDWACSPCYRRDFLSGCSTPACMTEISAAEVLPAVARALIGTVPAPLRWLQTTNARYLDRRSAAMAAHGEAVARP